MLRALLGEVKDDFANVNDPLTLVFGTLIMTIASRGWRLQGNCECSGHGRFFLAFYQKTAPILQIRGSIKSSTGKLLRLEVVLEGPGTVYDVHSLTEALRAIESVPLAT